MALSGRHWLVLVAALAAAVLTARLGVWQLHRAAQKIQLQQTMQSRQTLPPLPQAQLAFDAATAAGQHHRMTLLQGRWLGATTVYLENRQMNGHPGFFALTPLQLDDGSAVVVQRGWLPRDQADRTRVVVPPPPAGVVQVWGRIAPAPSRLYDFAGGASGAVRQNLDLDAFSRETGLRLRPLSVVQENHAAFTPSDGLLRQWLQPAADVSRNYGYAVQWFAMSALVIGLYVWFQLVRPTRQQRQAHA